MNNDDLIRMSEAIQRLRPNAKFRLTKNGLEWKDTEQEEPTQAEIDTEILHLESDDYNVEQWRQSASLSRRKFKIGEAVYKVNGTPLVQLIEALLAGLLEPQKTVASISYNESNSFDRLDAFVVQFGEALEMSEEEVDEFFQFCIDEAWQ